MTAIASAGQMILEVFKSKTAHTKLPSVLKDPFKTTKITNISMLFWNTFGEDRFHGSVEFKNGLTGGKQEFNAQNFEDLFLQIKSFIESLDQT